MGLLGTALVLLCGSSVLGLILPMTKTDGTLDVSSLMSHIALLEQSTQNKASAVEVAQLKSDLATVMKDMTISKNELTHLTSDLAASQKELADTKTKLTQIEGKLDTSNRDKTKMESDLAASKKELGDTKTELAQVETKLDTSIINLTKMESNLAASQKELGDTKIQLAQMETKLDGLTKTISDQDQELKDVKSDLNKAEIDISLLKNNKDNNTSTSPVLVSLMPDVSHLKTEVVQLNSEKNRTGTQNASSGGSTFTRWGRTSCPVNSTVVYKGYTGGAWFNDKASGANILCLPDQPIYANHTDAGHDDYYGSHIFGTEYNANYAGSPFKNLHNENMPCVVCDTESKTNVLMIPARNQCYSGWTLEYSGYLMGPSFNLASGEYICVDSDAEAIPEGGEDQSSQVMYPVESRCGSLPCPPYHDKWELTCAVCSK